MPQEPREHPRLWKQLLIQQLSQYYHTAQQQIYAHKFEEGRESYLEMLKIYGDLCSTDIEEEDKKVAHFCCQAVYDALHQQQDKPPISESSFRVLFSVSVLILLVGLAVVMKPSIVGLVTFDGVLAPDFVGTQTRFFIDGKFSLDLDELFESLDGNELDFLVTRSPTVDVDLSGSIVTFKPIENGLSRHTLIAISKRGDQYQITRVPIEIIVQ